MPNVDFPALKARLSFEDVIEHLKLPMTLKDGKYRGVCPACQSSTNRALVVTPERGAYCFDAKKGGDIIWLASHVQRIGVRQAAEALDQAFPALAEPSRAGGAASVPQRTEAGKPPGISSVASRLVHDHPAVLALGLDADTAKALGIGHVARGSLGNRVLIPVRTEHGEPVTYVGFNPDLSPSLKFGRINL